MNSVRLETHGAIAIVWFDNPPRGYMNAGQVAALEPVVAEVAGRADIRVVVFTGAVPGVFVRHYDVGEIVRIAGAVAGADDAALDAQGRGGNQLARTFEAVDRIAKPTIAAINGFAQGGGFEFALCCDLRIAARGDYRIGLPEVNIGIFPGAGGTERLPRLIGEARALELILRGRTLAPDDALHFGLVHEVADDALARALEIAGELAALPARGLAEAKTLVKRTGERPLDTALAEARGRFLRLIARDPAALAAMNGFLAGGEDINLPPD